MKDLAFSKMIAKMWETSLPLNAPLRSARCWSRKMKDAVEVAKRMNAKWATVVSGPYDSGLEWGYQTANVNDLYHQQIAEGNIIPNIDLAWEKIAYFQIGDNPGRNEPTTGEMNYKTSSSIFTTRAVKVSWVWSTATA